MYSYRYKAHFYSELKQVFVEGDVLVLVLYLSSGHFVAVSDDPVLEGAGTVG